MTKVELPELGNISPDLGGAGMWRKKGQWFLKSFITGKPKSILRWFEILIQTN
jgi:hypothetical protein